MKTYAGGQKTNQKAWKNKSSSAFIPTDPEPKCHRSLHSFKTPRTSTLPLARYSSELRRAGYWSVDADADMMANAFKIATGRRFIWGGSDHSTNECKPDKCGYDWRSRGYSDLHSSWLRVLLRLIDNFRHCLRYNSIERGTELSSLQAELNSSNAFTEVLLLPRAESSTASTYCRPPRFLKFNLRSRFPLSSLRLRSSRQHIDSFSLLILLFNYFWNCPKTYTCGEWVT